MTLKGLGYGAKPLDEGRRLDADTLTSLFEHAPEKIVWKAVLLERVAPEALPPCAGWRERVQWVTGNPEAAWSILATADSVLEARKDAHLVIFDAIDRVGTTWSDVVRAHRGLLALLLEVSGLRSIKAKAFVRLDVLQDPTVLRFADASKLHTASAELGWLRQDLYGLLWQYIANSAHGSDAFRTLSADWSQKALGIWDVPDRLRHDEAEQKKLWHRIAGRWMGKAERKGDTYSWLTNHLSDAFGRTSPRSFLSAVREAALNTAENEAYAIHYRALQDGVRRAAAIRSREIREDFPWTERALRALQGISVPCETKRVIQTWRADGLEHEIDRDVEARPRRHQGGDLSGVLDDLIDLGVMTRLRDGRVDVPDVYRLGFGIARRGGVPLKR